MLKGYRRGPKRGASILCGNTALMESPVRPAGNHLNFKYMFDNRINVIWPKARLICEFASAAWSGFIVRRKTRFHFVNSATGNAS